jgi:pimeloyl-ACP methyl ester carboxylesterase
VLRPCLLLATVLPLVFMTRPASAQARAQTKTGTVASADGVSIRYESTGMGTPALVLVHCWACDRRLWDAVAPRFSKSYQVVTLDLAGHGESGANRKEWTIEAYGEDVEAVVERLGLKKVILIGHSMGGSVILEAARRLPGRVIGLVPVDTLLNVEERTSEEDARKMEADLRKDFAGGVERFTRQFMFLPSADPALVDRVVRKNAAAPPDIAIPSLVSAWRYDPVSALREVRVPTHAVNSDRYPTNVEANRRHFASYEVTLMSGVGHYLMLENPAELTALLAGAVGSLDSKSGKVVAPRRSRRGKR